MSGPSKRGDRLLDRAERVGMIILGVSENRHWIELLYEGDLARSKRVELPSASLTEILVEEIPHKSTVYERLRTLIYLDAPCDVEIRREGNHVVVRGCRDA